MFKIIDTIREKFNPAQKEIIHDYGEEVSVSPNLWTNQTAYNKLEIVNRAVNLIVDCSSGIRYDVGDMMDYFTGPINLETGVATRIRKKKLDQRLNFRPNPYYNADVFKRNLIMDLILEGDAYVYCDGAFLYNLPALSVRTVADKKTYIKEYWYANTRFTPDEIIHIQENSGDNIFEGKSRLDSARQSIGVLISMMDFQKNFFDNSAVPGLIIKTPNPLSLRVKNRLLAYWRFNYSPKRGGKKPLILDGDYTVEPISKYNFKELEFAESIKTYENTILKVLGIPPILMDTGNNANITPNLKLFYINTVLPIVDKIIQAFEMYFGYDIKANTQDVLALRPELKDLANYLTSLTNGGILTRNEARAEIRYDKATDTKADELILPENIAGSAANPSVGGRPTGSNNTSNNTSDNTTNN